MDRGIRKGINNGLFRGITKGLDNGIRDSMGNVSSRYGALDPNLIFWLDASYQACWDGKSTSVFDMASGYVGTLINGPVYAVRDGVPVMRFSRINNQFLANTTSFSNGSSGPGPYQNVGSLSLCGQYFSFAIWVCDILPPNIRNNLFLTAYPNQINQGWLVSKTSSSAILFSIGGSQSVAISADNTMNPGWRHVVCVSNGVVDKRIYIDGREVQYATNQTTSVTIDYTTSGFWGMCSPVGGSGYNDGDISSVKIWNRVLTKEDVAVMFNRERSRYLV